MMSDDRFAVKMTHILAGIGRNLAGLLQNMTQTLAKREISDAYHGQTERLWWLDVIGI